MFFYFSSQKVLKVSIIMLLFLAGVMGFIYFDNKWEINLAFKLYTNKISNEVSYWVSNKLAESINPRNPSFFLWRVFAYETQIQNTDLKKAQSVPVLVYHGLPNEGIGQLPDSVFIEQMKTLKDNGWNTISLEQFSAFIKGQGSLPEKSFLLTFDDGRKDTFYPADPLFRDLGYKAVIFAITKRSISDQSQKSSYYLSSYELKEMEKSGRWEVESHGRDSHDWYYIDESGTLGHFFSDKFWLKDQNRMETDQEFKDRITYDLSASKNDLENALGKKITTIAFPFGDYGQESIHYPEAANIVKTEASKIYDFGFYQVRRGAGETFNYPEGQFMIKRIEPTKDWNGEYLLSVLESGVSKDMPYSANTFGSEWVSTWGGYQNGDTLSLKANNNTTGSSAILNGSHLWQDYTFTTDVNWQEGSNVVLSARMKDSDNYFGCNFGPNKVTIKKSSDGTSSNILEQPYSRGRLPQNLSLGIRVEGKNISCSVNGEIVIQGIGINPSIPNGGIGLEVWDEHPGKASATFDNASVLNN